MTYHTDQMQSMIAELDRVLRKSRSWNPWTLLHRFALQRYTLERVRNFLILQQRPTSAPHPIAPPLPPPPVSRSAAHPNLALKSDHQRLVQEIQTLTAQRNALKAEIKYLEQTQLLQAKSAPTQSPESAQNLASRPPGSPETPPAITLAEQQLAQLENLRERTDLLLSSMDNSLQLSCNSILKNVEVYNTTLNQGIDRMHSLGYQGEVLFSALVNHLAQGVGRELASNSSPTTHPPLDRFLTDLAPLPSPTEPSLPVSADPPVSLDSVPDSISSLTLEQIFADLPAAPTPSVTPSDNLPIAQSPVPEVEAPWGQFTLEEMDSLFADAPSLPTQLTA